MRVVIIYFGPFDVNSAIQAFHFGNELTELGWSVTMAGLDDPGRIRAVGEPKFECINHSQLPAKLEKLRAKPGGTVAFAWTPRERVRKLTQSFARELNIPYVVHLEDNENHLFAAATGHSVAAARQLPLAQQDRLTTLDLIHPTHHLEFLDGAAGITVITEELNEFNVSDRPHHVARPGIDAERFRPDLVPPVSRAELGLESEDFVLVYHGTIHYANQHEMLSLYLAAKLLRRRGHPVRLVRLGHTGFGGVDPDSFRALGDDVIELGPVPWREIPNYLALADAFVQPGPPDDFNRYRLPSKLPEFLAMGRPVILPHCNIGNDLTHGEDALLLEDGNALEIVARIEDLIAAPELAGRLGERSREFALRNLSWADNAAGLAGFFQQTMTAPAPSGVR
jgi:glycosyltransferase involved in cell wall biosynthesis